MNEQPDIQPPHNNGHIPPGHVNQAQADRLYSQAQVMAQAFVAGLNTPVPIQREDEDGNTVIDPMSPLQIMAEATGMMDEMIGAMDELALQTRKLRATIEEQEFEDDPPQRKKKARRR